MANITDPITAISSQNRDTAENLLLMISSTLKRMDARIKEYKTGGTSGLKLLNDLIGTRDLIDELLPKLTEAIKD